MGNELPILQFFLSVSPKRSLLYKPDIVHVQRPCAAGGRRGILGADANGNGVDIGKVNTERRQVNDPLVPSP